MTMQARPPLDPQERELAAQLARIRPRVEPGDDLDARILAMAAREATGKPASVRPPRRPRRWPAWLGAAASLAAVAGFLWQVHPILDPSPDVSPVMAPADAGEGGQRQPIRYIEPTPATAPVPVTPPPPPAPRSGPAQQTARATLPAGKPATRTPEVASATRPTPVEAKLPPPVSADIAGAPAAAETVPAPPAATAAAPVSVSGTRIDPPRAPVPPAPASPMPAPPAAPALRSAALPEPREPAFDERPPATTASGEVQQAWLARIRALKAEGRIDEARASLQEFRQRHPGSEIPAELKPLLEAPNDARKEAPKPLASGDAG